jgi:precorrin-6B methylase 2
MRLFTRIGLIALAALVAVPIGSAQQPPGLDVPYVPTPPEVVAQMLALAAPTKNDVLYDLGSGDGRIVITAAQRFGLRGMGVDLDPDRIQEANANAKQAGVTDRVRFVRQDLFKTDLRPASIVTLYLLPRVNLELRPRLFEQLRPGTRVVSHAFSMEEWEPDSVVTVNRNEGIGSATVYYWVIPARVAGTWTLTTPEGRRYPVKVQQQFQRFTANATVSRRNAELANPRLVGDRISFTLRDSVNGKLVTRQFSGRVTGNAMRGNVAGGGAWTATR